VRNEQVKAVGTPLNTQRTLIELAVAAAATTYAGALLVNYRGLLDFFLRQTERNRRAMRRLVFLRTPQHDESPYPPNAGAFRKWWRVMLTIAVVAGTSLVVVRLAHLLAYVLARLP
jgi:hypothetical protein